MIPTDYKNREAHNGLWSGKEPLVNVPEYSPNVFGNTFDPDVFMFEPGR